jgi:hypothetical protein
MVDVILWFIICVGSIALFQLIETSKVKEDESSKEQEGDNLPKK